MSMGQRVRVPADVCAGIHDGDVSCVSEEGGGRKSPQCRGAEVPPSCMKAHNLLAVNLLVYDCHGKGGVRRGGHGKDTGKREDNSLLLFVVLVLWELR